jgi:NRPS condensation-like uncharacterized protein
VDPLFEATVLRAETDTLCIRVDHVVADAAGMNALVRLLGTLYTRLATDKGLRATHSGASRALGQILREYPRQRRSALPPTVKAASSPLRLTQRGDPGAPRAMLLRRLGRSHLAAIRAYRIARNATTNDVLIGAVSHALWQAQGEPSGPHRVQVSVDLRRLVPGLAPARACNLAGAVFPVIDFRPGQPFDDTVASASAAMRAIEAGAPGLASARRIQAASRLGLAGMRALFAAMRARGMPVLPAIFSNLGMVGAHIDFEGIPLREAYSTGPVMVPPSFMLTASSDARGITCSVGTVAQGPARAEAERVLDGFLGHLPKPS